MNPIIVYNMSILALFSAPFPEVLLTIWEHIAFPVQNSIIPDDMKDEIGMNNQVDGNRRGKEYLE